MSEFTANTCDKDWKSCFIDRTEGKNSLVPMNKLLNLENFNLYWNSKEKLFLSEKTDDVYKNTLHY